LSAAGCSEQLAFTTQTRDFYVASGDIGFWQGALRDPATAQYYSPGL
jgi:hypothetical protein